MSIDLVGSITATATQSDGSVKMLSNRGFPLGPGYVKVTLNFNVINNGTADTPQAFTVGCSLKKNGKAIPIPGSPFSITLKKKPGTFVRRGDLGGNHWSAEFPVQLGQTSADYHARVMADLGDKIDETNESNNLGEFFFSYQFIK